MSASDNLIDVLTHPDANRDEIAAWYAAVIRYQPDADWPALNRAVLRRYKPSGLEYIKRKAWAYNAELARAAQS